VYTKLLFGCYLSLSFVASIDGQAFFLIFVVVLVVGDERHAETTAAD
jgi:hypothetical protein